MTLTKLIARVVTLVAVAAVTGCNQEEPCPYTFRNGSFVADRVTGERYVVINGSPFTNIFAGRCSIIVGTNRGDFAVSTFRVEGEQAKEVEGD